MPVEIERRFLVRVAEAALADVGPPARLRQGYVLAGDPSVRVRFGESRGAVLTVKRGRGIRRDEFEQLLADDVARALLDACGDRVLVKDRFAMGPWTVDRFAGRFAGLWLAEIELRHEDDPLPPLPTGVRSVREVTSDARFVSAVLVGLDDAGARSLVVRAYVDG